MLELHQDWCVALSNRFMGWQHPLQCGTVGQWDPCPPGEDHLQETVKILLLVCTSLDV